MQYPHRCGGKVEMKLSWATCSGEFSVEGGDSFAGGTILRGWEMKRRNILLYSPAEYGSGQILLPKMPALSACIDKLNYF